MKKIMIIIILFLVACQSTEKIKVEQVDTNLPVILRLRNDTNTIWVISFPIKVKITNTSFKERIFGSYKYEYSKDNLKGTSSTLYLKKDDKLIKKGISKYKYIKRYNSKEYIVYSRNFVDTTKFSRLYFKKYTDKMHSLNQDTLVVGSLKEFKKKHYKLVKYLLEKDTIKINFIKDYGKIREEELGVFGKNTVKKQHINIDFEVISIPVKW
ncbi:MAG: hypothetical protein L3J23_06185 [Flavobacteriaceae bacterium]|nr:hypothetical protein [Flavobacteriaceae bacterium]